MSRLHVPHTRQLSDWDCGLACVSSVAAAFGINQSINQLSSLVPTSSVWSIDLAYLLVDLGLQVELHTACAGVNLAHQQDRYYHNLEQDRQRVSERYLNAEKYGISMNQSIHPLSWIVDQLQSHRLVIALCDARFLTCPKCEETSPLSLSQFQGHFIVLTHVNPSINQSINQSANQSNTVFVFDYIDPSSPCEMCRMPGSFIDRARLQQGTDQDLIIVGKRVEKISDD